MPSDETPPTTLQTDLRRLGFNRTADDLNDLVATATRKRWSTTVMLEHIRPRRARRPTAPQRRAPTHLRTPRTLQAPRRLGLGLAHRLRPTSPRTHPHLDFLARGENVILVGAQGLGKTMLAKNVAHQAILAGHSALFTTAADLLLDLNGQEPPAPRTTPPTLHAAITTRGR